MREFVCVRACLLVRACVWMRGYLCAIAGMRVRVYKLGKNRILQMHCFKFSCAFDISTSYKTCVSHR